MEGGVTKGGATEGGVMGGGATEGGATEGGATEGGVMTGSATEECGLHLRCIRCSTRVQVGFSNVPLLNFTTLDGLKRRSFMSDATSSSPIDDTRLCIVVNRTLVSSALYAMMLASPFTSRLPSFTCGSHTKPLCT